ncbi:MAG: hypothetical protein ACOC0O_01735 [Spirochaetota bacterium]
MVLPSGLVQLDFSDQQINNRLKSAVPAKSPSTLHFSQNEEFFVRLPSPVEVGSFPVHHELGRSKPHPKLADAVLSLVDQLLRVDGSFLTGLTHLFDPSANTLPAFFRLYRMGAVTYLYMLRVDLTYRPRRSELVARTTNAETAHYRTRDLFLESDLFPLERVETEDGRINEMKLEQSVSDTWIGETGRGYMRAGMWLDRDLTKFFSRLFVPHGTRIYPYFPFTCKYRTIAHTVIALEEERRRRSVRLLSDARTLLLPRLREIEESLRSVSRDGFTEELPAFTRIKKSVGSEWHERWSGFSVRMYLNDEDEREFEVEDGLV